MTHVTNHDSVVGKPSRLATVRDVSRTPGYEPFTQSMLPTKGQAAQANAKSGEVNLAANIGGLSNGLISIDVDIAVLTREMDKQPSEVCDCRGCSLAPMLSASAASLVMLQV